MKMYCVKCRSKRIPNEMEIVRMKNDKLATKGKCPTCSTSMFSISPPEECRGMKVEGLKKINHLLKKGYTWDQVLWELDAQTHLRNILESKL